MNEIIGLTARALLSRLRAGEISPPEVLDALEARVDAVDGGVNALPTRCFERARAAAAALAGRPAEARGALGGLPVPIKDLSMVAGVRSTFGSPIYAAHVPDASDHVVTRIESAGGIVYAKSNTPEFGAGGSTFNPVFGRTANPWDLTRSVGGSSGGAAAALASGTAWLAHGSDLAGSLRTPASFCSVVGLRPSPALVPAGPGGDPFGTLAVEGPMARNVGDLGLLLDAMAGPHPAEPLSQAEAGPGAYRRAAETPVLPQRVAFSPDLGLTPVDPRVADICAAAARQLEALGVTVEEAHPDLGGAHEAFQTLRGIGFAAAHAEHHARHRDLLKPDVVWNIERGLAADGAAVAAATAARARIAAEMHGFLARYDLLLCPATIVPPFPVEARTVETCNGTAFASYIDWLAVVYAVTLTACPALSLPCGFTPEGWPVGLQMVGRFRGEAALLSHAAALEAALGVATGPIDPRPGPATTQDSDAARRD
ncbi:amidase family protein [Paralimibaculum aggregatum]|uniref:Amidase family protein n=1 Tax=Paralimibaculum aggregatum TaxID=3036245 RepID=A0ABQ6LI88_9RHOB|nr:amidase family protein [Limibaculum sp. NKW23]GMG81935.1 amidase family protein [Limibaculum sp. NKW23]